MIDLRSDTVTRPTAAMREAMAGALVGDDVMNDDPTVRQLERRTAEVLGMEAALYVPSGTMSNQLAVKCHTEAGDEIFLDADAHIGFYEAAGPAMLSGVMCRHVPARRGLFTGDDLAGAARPADVHFPRPSLVCLENTHNRGGGAVWPVRAVEELAAAARRMDLKVHMDGARLWNAAVASGTAERDYARHCDSVSVCFSKGLGAPVGSALVGRRAFIDKARRFRKLLGGGMRQAGIIAAGALHALEHHRPRLADDHAHARRLAEALARLPGAEIDPASVETNIVLFGVRTMPAAEAAARLAERGVAVLALVGNRLRAVTHLDVDAEHIEQAIAACRAVFGA